MVQSNKDTEILERGNIYFCYTPKVKQESVEKLKDVQQFDFVLAPHSKQSYRMIVIGKKRLPEIEGSNNKHWCYVETVTDNAQEIERGLRKDTYQTRTMGERFQPAARPVGEGIYEIVRHGGNTNLVYVLELPEELGEAQKDLGIKEEASYIITIKNPEASSPEGMGLTAEDKVNLPEYLQSRFQKRRFVPAEPTEFLDYPGVELILIGASANISEELGIELDPASETEDTAEILNDLRMRKSRHPIEPLFTGEWR
ncbi:MAG: hypothetical protein AAFR77_10215 [Cyanobacteria bacterium J06631_2]